MPRAPNSLRRRVGMVFQNFNLFPDRTALDNITLALRKVKGLDRREAERVARARLVEVGSKRALTIARPTSRAASSSASRSRAPSRSIPK